jgi:hypothetical protein
MDPRNTTQASSISLPTIELPATEPIDISALLAQDPISKRA